MNGPDFLIAGGHKCATTSIHSILAQHPRIAMSSVKEPHFLARTSLEHRLASGVWSEAEYERLWDGEPADALRGEASVLYMSFADEVVRRLGELDAQPKVILSLRHPVDRARSSYFDVRFKNPDETAPTFADAVRRELARGPWRTDGDGSPTLRHLALGRYSEGVRRLRDAVGPERLLVVLFDDFLSSPDATLAEIQEFLGIEPITLDHAARENEGGAVWRPGLASRVMRSRSAVHGRRLLKAAIPGAHRRLAKSARSRLAVSADPLEAELRAELVEFYRPEIAELETLLGRPLEHWRV